MSEPTFPSVEQQLADAGAQSGSALEQLIRENQDFTRLRPEEATDQIALPPWLRVYWRKQHPEATYPADDPTGGYPRVLRKIYTWMLTHQDLRPSTPPPPVPPKAQPPPGPQLPLTALGQVVVGTNLRISGSQTTPHSESNIRVNYWDTRRIIAASNDTGRGIQAQFYSKDGGQTWGQTTLLLLFGEDLQSDPTVDWTSDGTAWATTQGVQVQGSVVVHAHRSDDGGETWLPDAVVSGSQTDTDKQMMWVDHSPTSPFKDNIYAIWNAAVPNNGRPAFVNRRTGPSGVWQNPVQVSRAETTRSALGADIKTNSTGDVFAFWPDNGSNQLLLAKSVDGGKTFGAPVSITTTFGPSDIPVPAYATPTSPPARGAGALKYVAGAAFRDANRDLVYAVWMDLTGAAGCNATSNAPGANINSTCKTRIWFARSTDGGASWPAQQRKMVNDQPSMNDQFNPWLVVDESSGGLVIIYYDTVNDPGRLRADVWYQTSGDDGQTWNPAQQVTTSATDETASSADLALQYGDYNGLSGIAGKFYPSWTDRRNGAREEIWTAPITWSGINWQQLDNNPAANAIAAGGGQLYQLHTDGTIWRYLGTPLTGWEQLDNNPAATAIAASGSGQLYQFRTDGTIWRYFGTPMTGWEQLDNNPATTAIAAGSGGLLFQLHNDGTIWRYLGIPLTGWQQVDNNPAATAIAAGGGQLYQLHNDGSIWRYLGTPITGWERLDNNPATSAIAASGSGQLYQLHTNRSIWRYLGTPMTGWLQLDNNLATMAIAPDGDGKVYQLHSDGTLWFHAGVPLTGWQQYDNDPGATAIAAGRGRIYQLHSDGSIWFYTGRPVSPLPGWQQLDDNAATTAIAADGTGALYQLHNDGSILQYTGTPMTGWQQLDNNAATTTLVASNGQLYQLHNDGSIFLYTGTPMTGWQLLDNNSATTALAAGGAQLYQLHNDGTIWLYTGTPLTGWQQLDNNPATTAIVAGGAALYQLHNDGTIFVYTGTPFTGWQLLDNNPATVSLAAGNGRLYQLHTDGTIWLYTGTPLTGWQLQDTNPSTTGIAASSAGQLYQLHNDGTVWLFTGTPLTGWQQLANSPATQTVAPSAGAQLHQLRNDGSIWLR